VIEEQIIALEAPGFELVLYMALGILKLVLGTQDLALKSPQIVLEPSELALLAP